MIEIKAASLRRRFSKLLNAPGPEGVVVTPEGKPIARLLPIVDTNGGDCADLIGCTKVRIRVKGSLYSTGLHWNAERHPRRSRMT